MNPLVSRGYWSTHQCLIIKNRAWDKVINCDKLFSSILKKSQSVHSALLVLLGNKDPLEKLWPLDQQSYKNLYPRFGLWRILEFQGWAWHGKKLGIALPKKSFGTPPHVINQLLVLNMQRLVIWRKFGIDEIAEKVLFHDLLYLVDGFFLYAIFRKKLYRAAYLELQLGLTFSDVLFYALSCLLLPSFRVCFLLPCDPPCHLWVGKLLYAANYGPEGLPTDLDRHQALRELLRAVLQLDVLAPVEVKRDFGVNETPVVHCENVKDHWVTLWVGGIHSGVVQGEILVKGRRRGLQVLWEMVVSLEFWVCCFKLVDLGLTKREGMAIQLRLQVLHILY